MLNVQDKIFVYFGREDISIYILKDNKLHLKTKMAVDFSESCVQEALLEKVNTGLEYVKNVVGEVNNERIRLYATGVFQSFTPEEQTKLVIHVFVNYGLYFNIVERDLELFYLEKSRGVCGSANMMEGLVSQEFRKVVICGSFQQYLDDIGEVLSLMQKRNIEVLSPWTTKVVPETLGTDFILLEGQELKNKRDAWRHKYEHMDKFRRSDAIIICNPDGLVGQGTMFEFGFMVACSKRIIFIQKPTNVSIPFPYEVGLNFK